MSELKVHKIGDLCFDFKMGKDVGIDFYLKSEADKVIVEQTTLRAWAEMQLRHYKYKHCLDMADKCLKLCWKAKDLYHWAEDENLEHYYNHKIEFFARWHNRWLELAEKFKEAK